MDADHYVDDYAEDWITFMMGYAAQKENPALSEVFFERVDPYYIDLLNQYEAGSIDLPQLRDTMIAYAKAQPPVRWEDIEGV